MSAVEIRGYLYTYTLSQQSGLSDGRQGNDYQQCSDLRAVFSSYCVLIYLFVLIIIMPNIDECTFKWLAEELQSLIWADVHQTNTDCLSR